MMDVILATKLVKAIPDGAHLLVVGDVDQLPSVGAGEVLRVLAAECIPRVRLTQIFRQAQQSGIVVNAHRISQGQPPQLTGYRDFYWFACDPAACTRRRRQPASSSTSSPAASPPNSGSTRSATSKCSLRCAADPSEPATSTPYCRKHSFPSATGRRRSATAGRVFRVGDMVTQLG
jgi:exodeoxyribonuclease V alpha subunit